MRLFQDDPAVVEYRAQLLSLAETGLFAVVLGLCLVVFLLAVVTVRRL